MDSFLEQLSDRIVAYREALEAEGFTEDEAIARTTERLNQVSTDYYGRLMELLSEDDYQAYRQCIGRQDVEGLDRVLLGYQNEILALQKKLIKEF